MILDLADSGRRASRFAIVDAASFFSLLFSTAKESEKGKASWRGLTIRVDAHALRIYSCSRLELHNWTVTWVFKRIGMAPKESAERSRRGGGCLTVPPPILSFLFFRSSRRGEGKASLVSVRTDYQIAKIPVWERLGYLWYASTLP